MKSPDLLQFSNGRVACTEYKQKLNPIIIFAYYYARTHSVGSTQLILAQHLVESPYTVSNAPLSPPHGAEPPQSRTHFSKVQSTYHALVPTLPRKKEDHITSQRPICNSCFEIKR